MTGLCIHSCRLSDIILTECSVVLIAKNSVFLLSVYNGVQLVNRTLNIGKQGRPLFSDLEKNYPTTSNVADVYALVGGGLLRSYNQDPVSYANT